MKADVPGEDSGTLKLWYSSQADLVGGNRWTYRTFECLINEAAGISILKQLSAGESASG